MSTKFPPQNPTRFRGKRLLLIGDNELLLPMIRDTLRDFTGIEIVPLFLGKPDPAYDMEEMRCFDTPEKLKRYAQTLNYDAVLTTRRGKVLGDADIDFDEGKIILPEEFGGIEFTKIIKSVRPDVPVLMHSNDYGDRPVSQQIMAQDADPFWAAGGSGMFHKLDFAGVCDALEQAFATQRGK